MSSSSLAPASQETHNICQTAECIETAKSLLNFIDFNVDPCSDFYQYTCGSWLRNATLPPDEYSTGPYTDATNVIAEVIHNILEGEYEDLYKNLKDGDTGFHTDDEQEADKQNFKAMKDYYNLCIDTSAMDKLGSTPIYHELSKIQNSIFPVIQNETYSSDKINRMTDILIYLSRSFKDTIVSLSVYNDYKNSNENAIYITSPTLTLQSKQTYEATETLQKFSTLLSDLLTTVIGQPECKACDPEHVETSKDSEFQLWPKEKVQSAVANFITIETALANISTTTTESQDLLSTYNVVKLADFQRNHPLIDWQSYLKGLLPQGTPLPETIINSSPTYFTGLNQVLSGGINMTSLQDYFIISYITKVASTLDSSSRDALNRIVGDLLLGTTVEKPRWRTCVDSTSQVFDASLGRYYILHAFGSETERNKTETFITSLHDSWRKRIPATEWLDAETREKAMEKLNLIKHKTAYTTISPDVRSPLSLSKYNDGLQPNLTSFFDSEVKQWTWYKSMEWKKVGKPVDRDTWLLSPQTVNAYYFATNNEIAVPTGFLQPIFYDNNFPASLNYGSVGYIIGHEISHGFDSRGRLFDGRGNLVEWWTNITSKEFVNRSQCFIDQYSNFNITGPDGKAHNVDGRLTLSENIADNGGAAASFFAYQNLRPNRTEEPRLPGLTQLSPEQLFFINFGRTWCSLQSDQINLLSLYTDPHSPAAPRVNGVVQNSVEFSKAFNCPTGSAMNPETKCKIW